MLKFASILLFTFFLLPINHLFSQSINTGFRASRILQSYPNRVFPSETYWIKAANNISKNFSGSQPSAIWIVSLYWSNGEIGLDFPSEGKYLPYVNFMNKDYPESYLNAFDTTDIKVWLQIEPGAANVDSLINIILNRYKKHKCVAGFGIDVEWYLANEYKYGKQITDIEAERWEKLVKSYNSSYTLFLKHFNSSWLPPNYRGNIIFVDDSQEFNSLSSMVNEFKLWGKKFNPNDVWFQYGYTADKKWWSSFDNPMKTIGDNLIQNIPNLKGLIWVDFTITQIIPLKVNLNINKNNSDIIIYNYPNPFNSETQIDIHLPVKDNINVEIIDILGRKVKKLWSGIPLSNKMNFEWNTKSDNGYSCSSGLYFIKVYDKEKITIKKIQLLK